MNILVFGGSGQTGRELLSQAVGLGHQVTACVRTPAKLGDAVKVALLARVIDVPGRLWTAGPRRTDWNLRKLPACWGWIAALRVSCGTAC